MNKTIISNLLFRVGFWAIGKLVKRKDNEISKELLDIVEGSFKAVPRK